jgi:hypothetical protein
MFVVIRHKSTFEIIFRNMYFEVHMKTTKSMADSLFSYFNLVDETMTEALSSFT